MTIGDRLNVVAHSSHTYWVVLPSLPLFITNIRGASSLKNGWMWGSFPIWQSLLPIFCIINGHFRCQILSFLVIIDHNFFNNVGHKFSENICNIIFWNEGWGGGVFFNVNSFFFDRTVVPYNHYHYHYLQVLHWELWLHNAYWGAVSVERLQLVVFHLDHTVIIQFHRDHYIIIFFSRWSWSSLCWSTIILNQQIIQIKSQMPPPPACHKQK